MPTKSRPVRPLGDFGRSLACADAFERLACVFRCIVVTIAFGLSVGQVAVGQSAASTSAKPPQPVKKHAIQTLVEGAGQHEIQPEAVKHWLGDQLAYQALLRTLDNDPKDTQVWRNSIQALSMISVASAQLAQATLDELTKFVVNDRRFKSSKSALGTPAEPSKFIEAAFLAKTVAPQAYGILAKGAPPKVAEAAVQLLQQWAEPAYWGAKQFQWPADDYDNEAARNTDLAVLSVRALRQACTPGSEKALNAILLRIQNQKTPFGRNPSPDTHTVFLELTAPSDCPGVVNHK